MYDEDALQDWELLSRKSVPDSDGFLTEYSLYRSSDGSTFICMFGDSDIYEPDLNYADYETDDEDVAWEWFNNYEGFTEDDIVDEDEIYSASDTFTIDFDKLTSKNWAGMVAQLEDHGLIADAAYRRRPDRFILAYHDKEVYQIEVTQYFRGDFEVLAYNIHRIEDQDVEDYSALSHTSEDDVTSELRSLYQSIQAMMDTIGDLEDAYAGQDIIDTLDPVYKKLESAWNMLGKHLPV